MVLFHHSDNNPDFTIYDNYDLPDLIAKTLLIKYQYSLKATNFLQQYAVQRSYRVTKNIFTENNISIAQFTVFEKGTYY